MVKKKEKKLEHKVCEVEGDIKVSGVEGYSGARIRLVGGLHLRKDSNTNLLGGEQYFARLYFGIVTKSEKIPDGVRVDNLPDYLDIEIPKDIYDRLERGFSCNSYGGVTIELGIDDEVD